MNLHLILSWIVDFYPFLFQVQILDYIFLIIAISIPFSWSMFNGECVISLLAKKGKNPAYVAGTDLESDLKEFYISVFGSDLVHEFVQTLILVSGVILVLLRQGFPLSFAFYVFAAWLSFKVVVFWRDETLNRAYTFIFGSILAYVLIQFLRRV